MKRQFDFEPRWWVVIIFFAAGSFLGGLTLLTWFFNGSQFLGIQKIHPSKGQYIFINPLLAVDTDRKSFLENNALQSQVSKIIEDAKHKSQITDGSVYFRDIESGHWMGANESSKFSPGKLLSIPIMIAYFKNAEDDTKTLLKEILIKNPPTTTNLLEGMTYTVDDLIKEMIINGDEYATELLYDNIDTVALNEIYSDLGIDLQEASKYTDDYLSTKAYSLLFRILYNSTYLNPKYSELAVSLISEGSMPVGVAASLPNNIPIAIQSHSRSIDDRSGRLETYNCGIAYYPGHPYLICATAVGKNQQLIDNFLKIVGEAIYNNVDSQYKSIIQ
jgi:hypothetical protein